MSVTIEVSVLQIELLWIENKRTLSFSHLFVLQGSLTATAVNGSSRASK